MVAKKKTAKTSAKKPAVKASKVAESKKEMVAQEPAKTIAVQAVTESGVVTMKSVDDPGTATEGDAITVKAVYDKETGVITMVPVE